MDCKKDRVSASRVSPAQRQNASGGSLMLRTVFFLAIMIWMLGLALQFGGGVFHLLLVVAAIVLVMRRMLPRRSFY